MSFWIYRKIILAVNSLKIHFLQIVEVHKYPVKPNTLPPPQSAIESIPSLSSSTSSIVTASTNNNDTTSASSADSSNHKHIASDESTNNITSSNQR